MDNFQFLGFEPTPNEKFVGVATVRVHGTTTIVLRYKIVPKKDGKGHFPTCASYKMPDREPGDEYDECFMLDSRSDNDAMIKFIMHHFNAWQKNQAPSAFNQNYQTSAPMQPNPNYAPQAQQPNLPFAQRAEYQPDYASNPPEMAPFDDSQIPF